MFTHALRYSKRINAYTCLGQCTPSHSFTETPEKLQRMANENVKKAVQYRSQVQEMRELLEVLLIYINVVMYFFPIVIVYRVKSVN